MSNSNEPASNNGKICYLEIPSKNIKESSSFYNKAFGWNIRTRGDGATAFDDITGQVSGAWRADRKPFSEFGILIYIMVDNIETTIKLIEENGGTIVQPVGGDAPEITARFADPSGNILGLYQEPV